MSMELCVGIDVSKDHLDVATYPNPDAENWQFANDPQGIAQLLQLIGEKEPRLVALEASGGYEREVSVSLAIEEFPTLVINPRQVRDYAKSLGILAKTDEIDAGVIARFASTTEAEARPVPDQQAQELKALVARRVDLVETITAEKNRLRIACQSVTQSIKRTIEWLQTELAQIEQAIHAAIQNSDVWRVKDQLIRSMPGIGETTSAVLIAYMPELGTVGRKQIAALAGVAPYNCDSGKFQGERHIWGGRAVVRNSMYMPAMAATRHNAPIREFFEHLSYEIDKDTGQLVQSKKAYRVKLIACMHKMLTHLNAMLRDNLPWRPNP